MILNIFGVLDPLYTLNGHGQLGVRGPPGGENTALEEVIVTLSMSAGLWSRHVDLHLFLILPSCVY